MTTLTKIAAGAIVLQAISYAASFARCAETAHGLFF